MIKVCPACKATCMGGRSCRFCGTALTDAADRAKREDFEGVGVSIRALYAARAAMVLSCMGFLFGAFAGAMLVRQGFGTTGLARGLWWAGGVGLFLAFGWGFTRLGGWHYHRTLAANRQAAGVTGAEHDFFPDGEGIST